MEEWPLAPTVTNMDRFMAHSVPSNTSYPDTSSNYTKEEPIFRHNPPIPLPRRASTDIVNKTQTLPVNFKLTNHSVSPDSPTNALAADLTLVKLRANTDTVCFNILFSNSFVSFTCSFHFCSYVCHACCSCLSTFLSL